MGLWMIQSIRRELNGVSYVEGKSSDVAATALSKLTDRKEGHKYSFAELCDMAQASSEYSETVDVNDNRFLNPVSMTHEVMTAVAEKGGKAPQTIGELMQCVYLSLAKCYADAIKNLAAITGKTYTSMNIVGGGCQDEYLNKLTSVATGLEVFAGPIEGTAIGNLVVQMIAAGEFSNLAEARKAIQR
jgi:rhamnulokinase